MTEMKTTPPAASPVHPSATPPATDGAAVKKEPAAKLEKKVNDELRWDVRLQGASVHASVGEGVVTLTGTVDNYARKVAAREAVHRVRGVQDIADEIQVEVPRQQERSDEDLARAVREALRWHVLVPHEHIHTIVDHGYVILEGLVDQWAERSDADRAVSHLAGVRAVENKIRVRQKKIDADAVRRAVEAALERWGAGKGRQIRVQVRDGVVAVSGRVPTWFEKQAVLGAVRHTRGVSDVEDRLEVTPGV